MPTTFRLAPSARTLRRGGSAALALALVGGAAVLTAGPAQAVPRDNHRYALFGTAYPQLYELSNDDLPASPTQSAASAVASSNLTSVGDSFAFSAAPYYGSTATTLPSLAGGLASGLANTQVDIPVKSIPGLVSSRYPSSTTKTEMAGAYTVTANSQQYASSARGSNGGPEGAAPNQQQLVTSSTSADAAGHTTVNTLAQTAGVAMGPLNAINAISKASITDVGGKPVLTSSASGSFGVGPLEVTFGPKGFGIAGMGGEQAKQALESVNKILAAQRMKIETNLSKKVVDKDTGQVTFTAAALRVTETQNIPDTGIGAATSTIDIPVYSGGVPAPTGDATAVYTFGYVQVSSGNAQFAADPSGGGSSTGTTGTKTGTTTGVKSGGSTSGNGTTTGVTPVSVDNPIAAAPSSSGLPEVKTDFSSDSPPSVTSDSPDAIGFAPVNALRSDNTELLYLVLVLGGAALVGGQQLFSRFGLKLALPTHRTF